MSYIGNEQRGPWYLLTGVVIGLVLGLVYSWWIHPVEYVDTPPSSLRGGYKDQYRLMIAYAFAANPDMVRAQERLKLLKDADPQRALTEQAQRILANEGSEQDARTLGALAAAFQQLPEVLATPTIETEP
jgi:hypothetical protein